MSIEKEIEVLEKILRGVTPLVPENGLELINQADSEKLGRSGHLILNPSLRFTWERIGENGEKLDFAEYTCKGAIERYGFENIRTGIAEKAAQAIKGTILQQT